tara:strand:- start:236 stop:346 length:111 start_codon:yes stop_codon:yes gene_type:complete
MIDWVLSSYIKKIQLFSITRQIVRNVLANSSLDKIK